MLIPSKIQLDPDTHRPNPTERTAMLFTRIAHIDAFDDPKQYEKTDEAGIFKNVSDGYFMVALEYRNETDEDTQYPLEDVLDTYLAHIEVFEAATPEDPKGQVDVFAASKIERAQSLVALVGKRVYNKTDENGGVSLEIDDSVGDAKL
ncbi:hypothetical protein [Parenemella sanctibonifatiensis]|uniref:Uncharacterized protein n=1 Tax=Parenemella sanctibonifatiensis TaxID=2016505 RepID=A0A255ELL8_9ACTN|nr:hypothetical protein [Parenemella sanctibonifatiensis]OYN92427.1 hypothetical protein CGZ91_02735 [Parenemella sanctibonifatiensis]